MGDYSVNRTYKELLEIRIRRIMPRSQGKRLIVLILMSLVNGPKTLVALRAKKNRKEIANMTNAEKYGWDIGEAANT